MSKEQTPIEKLLVNDLTEMYHNKEMSYDTYSMLHDLISIASEQYAQAKVLEALEEVIKLSHYVEYGGEAVDVVEVRDIETEVKPKYERN